MPLRLRRSKKNSVLAVAGRATVYEADELKSGLRRAFDGSTSVCVDVAKVAEADLSFLQLLCAAHRAAENSSEIQAFSISGVQALSAVVGQAFADVACPLATSQPCLLQEEDKNG